MLDLEEGVRELFREAQSLLPESTYTQDRLLAEMREAGRIRAAEQRKRERGNAVKLENMRRLRRESKARLSANPAWVEHQRQLWRDCQARKKAR